jgi:gamma-glutamylputrescine oxidase
MRVIPAPPGQPAGYEYWQQRPDRSLALGGFRDHALAAEWTGDAQPSGVIQGLLEKFLREHLKVRAPITHRWAACVSYAEDGLPFLEELRPRTWAVGADSGTGNVGGALRARGAARRLRGAACEWADLLRHARGRLGRV